MWIELLHERSHPVKALVLEREAESVKPIRPIKVCFISPLGYGLYRPDSGSAFGGAEVQFFLLSRELSADPRFQVAVLTTAPGQPGTEQHGPLIVIRREGRGRLSSGSGRSWREVLRAPFAYTAAFLEMWGQLRGPAWKWAPMR
jgi:hypothetical protein